VAKTPRWKKALVCIVGTSAAVAMVWWVPAPRPTAEASLQPVQRPVRSTLAIEPPDATARAAKRPVDTARVPKVEGDAVDERIVNSALLHAPEVALGVLEGHVVGDDGSPLTDVQVLARSETGGVHGTTTDADGRFRFALPEGRLLVAASRWDELVEVRSEDVLVRLDAHAERYVPLTLQAEAGADAGLVAVERPDGFEVTWAVPGLAAHELGLAAGDRILTVDGQAATELTLGELERRLVGTEGTAVSLTVVEGDDVPRRVEVPRWGLDADTLAALASADGVEAP